MKLVKVERNSNYAWAAEKMRMELAVEDTDVQGANVATFQIAYPIAAFPDYAEYSRDGKYCQTPVTAVSDNSECAEQKLMAHFAKVKAKGALVMWIFTEREPCGPEVHNCHQLLESAFGDSVPVYYAHPYPSCVNRRDPIKKNTKAAIQEFGKVVYDKVQDELALSRGD